jgi:tripartite-type tricarboxylate transporter receptor subunit TctC
VRSGNLRGRAVAGTRRSSFLPDVPTTASLGIAGLPGQGWYGAFVRSNTATATVDALRLQLQRAAAMPAFQAQLRELYLEPVPAQSDALDALVREELSSWERITRQLNLYRSE